MKKRIIAVVLAFAMLAAATATVVSASGIAVYVNGAKLAFDVEPVVENSRTLVPMRAIFEALGAVVSWDGAAGTITAVKGGEKIVLKLGSAMMTIYDADGDIDTETLEVPPKAVSGRTLVPLRAVSEALDCDVRWDGKANAIYITSDDAVVETPSGSSDVKTVIPAGYVTVYDGTSKLSFNGPSGGAIIDKSSSEMGNFYSYDEKFGGMLVTAIDPESGMLLVTSDKSGKFESIDEYVAVVRTEEFLYESEEWPAAWKLEDVKLDGKAGFKRCVVKKYDDGKLESVCTMIFFTIGEQKLEVATLYESGHNNFEGYAEATAVSVKTISAAASASAASRR